MRIDAFHSRDLGELVRVWNRNLPADPVSSARLEARVFLDPNYRETYTLVAIEAARLIGFTLGICGEGFCYQARPVPPEQMGSRAWILALAVEKEHRGRGVGSALLRELEGRFRAAGKRQVCIASYPTAYLVPGVDKAAYAEGLAFLHNQGYRTSYTALAMDATLWPPAFPKDTLQREGDLAAQGFAFSPYAPRWLSAFRAFLRQELPWDWEWLALRNLARMHEGSLSREQIHLALYEERVVGYAQYEGAHFGPFGVAEGFQEKGIGTVLLAHTLASMVERGLHHAWVLWTGERAARLYGRFGFRVSRRFAVLNKELQ
jgi:GNAT superfamily N-acetyltransferase